MDENNINKKYGAKIDIKISRNPLIFDFKKIEKKFVHSVKENSFLFFNDKSNKLSISEYHDKIKEDEHVIFKIDFENDKVQFINFLYKDSFKRKEMFYNYINELNFRLYKILEKYQNDKNIDNTYFLEMYDIIKMNKIKLILRDCKINEKRNYDKNPQYIFLLEDEKNENCILCKKSGSSPENPLIHLCECKVHFECKKKEIKELLNSKKMNNDENCIKYTIKTKCKFCQQKFPLYFLCNNKQFELLDIPKDDDFLLFESLDNIDKNIYYIKLDKNKNKEKILISSPEDNNDIINKFDKFIEIDNNLISNEKAVIECDKVNKTLALKNIGDENNISVLQEKILLKPNNDKLLIYFSNILIEAQLINNDKFVDIEKEIEKNSENIEERK